MAGNSADLRVTRTHQDVNYIALTSGQDYVTFLKARPSMEAVGIDEYAMTIESELDNYLNLPKNSTQ